MRIGILTFHTAHNYGAVLQCYALQEYLRSCGHEVEVIDYRLSVIQRDYRVFYWKRFISVRPLWMLKKIGRECRLMSARRQRYHAFEAFIQGRLRLTPLSSIMDRPFDRIVIGSDQVWNTSLTNGFSAYYWGAFPHPSVTGIVSYAASMQDSWPAEQDETISRLLQNFTAISVREQTLVPRLSVLASGRTVVAVADPTLLLSREQWDSIAVRPPIDAPYLLLYQVETHPNSLSIAKSVASDLGLKLVCLSVRLENENSRETLSTSPELFVGLFKYASFVVCSSFHGTVFSLIYNVPFYTIRMNKGKDNRVRSLLDQLGLQERFISNYVSGMVHELKTSQAISLHETPLLRTSFDYLSSVLK